MSEILSKLIAEPGTLLSAIGAVAAIAGSIGGFLLRDFFGSRDKKLAKVDGAVLSLKKEHDVFKEKILLNLNSLNESVHKLAGAIKAQTAATKGDLELIKNDLRHYATDVAKLDGKIENQLNLVSTHISTIGHISRQMNRIFEYIDAPKRTTDIADKKVR